jgi:hypothetical protein
MQVSGDPMPQPPYPIQKEWLRHTDRRLGGPQHTCVYFGEEKSLLHLLEIETKIVQPTDRS